MQASDYYPDGFKTASTATSADCVAQAASGASDSLEEGPASSSRRGPHIGGGFPSALCNIPSIHTIYLIHQQNIVSKTLILTATYALQTMSWGLACGLYEYIYTLNTLTYKNV